MNASSYHPTRRRKTGPMWTRASHQPRRKPEWANLSDSQILARLAPGKAEPTQVLELLLRLFNARHTARDKSVSHKTRQERAQFIRRAFGDLHARCGFKQLPDPRNLAQRHVQALVDLWQRERLSPATIQTYLSFLRGLALWIGKPGLIRGPDFYGLAAERYERHGYAEHDRSWSARSVDIDATVERICEFDPHVGAAMRLIRAFGLRRKEAVMLRPHRCMVPFEATALPPAQRAADHYVRIKAGAKGGRERFIPVSTPQRLAALAYARGVAVDQDAHVGHPDANLRQNLRRFHYVLDKFGVTAKALGVTAHGLRHEALIDHYAAITGAAPPVRGGAELPREIERPARAAVAALAGHSRIRVADAYLGRPARGRSVPNRADAP
ncbi:integrase domain-containing protein [Luteimonas sp. BDR2-5]|uniref:integrase domain-containing protein n=1 Tax=Proluteimonas luteida TaxID=2878685 RepID=UPI001E3D41F7|nr:integrase domain-containing protein [Luteimonas sp. BDR2-5]MCD9026828.1 integrase domain-containing protein [Luteimonas sp. BDR2-5]